MSTIRDVARIAGVSVGTVSNYFNGAAIKSANRERIEAAVRELNFRINPMARGLKTNRSNTIGIVIQDLSELFEATYAKIIGKRLSESGFNFMICDSALDPEIERKQVEFLLSKRVDGIVIAPTSDSMDFMEMIQQEGVPCVLIDCGTRSYECDQVLIDNDNATYEATEHLIRNRHRRIGIITGADGVFTARERLKGYRRALDNYHIDADPELIQNVGWDEATGQASMVALLDLPEPPTAVLACNFQATLGAIRACYQKNVTFPQTVSLIGFDDMGVTGLIRPELTTVSQPLEELGTMAADLILRRIQGDYSDFPRTFRFRTTLKQKASVLKLI